MTGYFFSAATAAFTKKLMKPILTPCSFSNLSWKRLRISITGAMLTSLKVVRMALVDCDCSRRSAMRARRRLIGTRCSGRSPRSACARRGDLRQRLAPARPARRSGAARRAGLAPPASAPSTSPLVTRPSLPVPAHGAGGQVVVGHQLGGGRHGDVAPSSRRRGSGRGAAPAAAAGAAAGGRGGAGAAAAALPSVSILAITCSATHGVAVGLDDLGEHAGGRRRHFEHDLVGLDLDQDLVDARRPRRASSSTAAAWLRRPIRTVAGP